MIAATGTNVASKLTDLSKSQPDRAALIDMIGGDIRETTFSQLDHEVECAAGILRSAGAKPLDVVLIYVPLQRELISLLLAVFRLGAQALFIDPTYGPVKIWHCLRLARPRFLVYDNKLQALSLVAPLLSCSGVEGLLCFTQRQAREIAGKLKVVRGRKIENENEKENENENENETKIEIERSSEFSAGNPALITFTSGSTGKPKGIVRTHAFLNLQAELLAKTLPEAPVNGRSDYRVMTTLPMFILAALAAGQTAIMAAADDERLFKQLSGLSIDRLLCAPRSLEKICKVLSQNTTTLPDIKQVVVGGGPVFASLITKTKAVFPGADFVTVYGSTEAEPICHRTISNSGGIQLKPYKESGRGLALGRPIAEIDLCVIDWQALGGKRSLTGAEFDRLKMPGRCEGEIVVAGEHVIQGYLCGIGDEETKINVDGRIFHRTGDAGYIDASGEVFLTGRAAYGVRSQGGTVYPLSVEVIAMESADVEGCAFVAVQDKSVLALKLKKGSSQSLITEQIEKLISHTEIKVDRIVVVDSLPVDERHGSKIIYDKLKRQLAKTA